VIVCPPPHTRCSREKDGTCLPPANGFVVGALDGGRTEHEHLGLSGRAVTTTRWRRSPESKRRGFRTIIKRHAVHNAQPEKFAAFFDDVMAMGVDGIFRLDRLRLRSAPGPADFLNRRQDQGTVSRHSGRQGQGTWKKKGGRLISHRMFLDCLAGNQTFTDTPWGNPTAPISDGAAVYLLGEAMPRRSAN